MLYFIAVKRLLREAKELREDDSEDYCAEPLEVCTLYSGGKSVLNVKFIICMVFVG
jgi:hypothetical protein